MLKKRIKNIFLTGLAVTIPIGLTLYILFFIIDVMDGLLKIIPDRYEPDALLGFHIPGLGIIFTVLLSRVSVKFVLRGLKPLWFIIVLTFVLNTFFYFPFSFILHAFGDFVEPDLCISVGET